jgi:hypothetical protein
MRIAYLVLAHHRPRQLARLVARLSGPETRFFIHFDRNAPDAVFREAADALRGRQDVEFVERMPCAWGEMSQVAAIMGTLRAALAAEFRLDVAVLLSGQDYPIKNSAAIRDFFATRRGQSIVDCWALPSERWANELGGRERYEYWNVKVGRRFLPIFGPRGFANPLVDRLWNGLASLVAIKRRFPRGLRPFGGATWWALSRDAADHVCRYADEHPEVARFFRWVKLPDEMYLHTILMSSPHAARVVQQPLHFTSWPPLGATSPRILGAADFAALAAAPQLFARKFDQQLDAAILDRIDRELLAAPARLNYSAA